eukprot:12907183-Prorocentrum_lima.AAC.1
MIKSSHEQSTDVRKCAEGLKSVPMTSKEVAGSKGETLTEWKQSTQKELEKNFDKLEGLAVATPSE